MEMITKNESNWHDKWSKIVTFLAKINWNICCVGLMMISEKTTVHSDN